MNASDTRAVAAREGRALRRADRRRRHLRHRRRLPPDAAVPGHQLRRARGAGELRRHLDHAPLPRHPLRQRPLHLRLPLQAVDRRAHRHRRRDPEVHERGHRRERPRPAHPLPPPHRRARAGRAPRTCWTIEATRTDTGEALRFTAGFLWMCQGYYRHAEGYTPEWHGHGRLHGPHRPPADLAGGPRLHGQAGRRHRLRRHRGDADPGDGRRLRAHHDAAALADLLPHRPQRHRHRRRAAPARRSTRPGSTRSSAARSSTSRPSSRSAASPSPRP